METSSQELDRDNGGRVCQTTDVIQFKDIKLKKGEKSYRIIFHLYQQTNNPPIKK